ELGQHDRRVARESRHRALARVPAGRRDVPHRALVQPGRRRAARDHRSAAGSAMSALLSVERLSVDISTRRGNLRAVDRVDLTLAAGRTLGIAGESSSGKTMLSRAVLQLLPRNARLEGRVRFDGKDLTALSPRALRGLRGRSLAVVFQDPMTSLNPVLTIGQQLVETLREHLGMSGAA